MLNLTSLHAKDLDSSSQIANCGIDSVIISNPQCNNQCSGVISVFAHGNGPLFYQWPTVPGVNSSVVTGLCAGTYSVIITDSTGCISTDSMVVSEPPPIHFNFSVINTTCPGGCSGKVTVNPLDTGTFSYHWPGFISTGPVLNFLCQGTFTVIITNQAGCTVSGNATVSYNPPFQVSDVSSPASCFTTCDGTATVTANGISPFTYQWQTGPIQSTQTAVNLCAGVYVVNVADSIGCVVSDTITVGTLPPPVFTNDISSPVCFGGCNGQASVAVAPIGNYSYEWNTFPVQYSSSAYGLCAGSYLVNVTDSNTWCVFADTILVSNPPPPQVFFTTTPSYCTNICSGTALVQFNGTLPHTYLWQSGNISQMDTSLCPGVYSVTVTDSAGCSTNASVNIELQELFFNITNATCNTICDGSSQVNLPPGQWQVNWNTVPNQNTPLITGLCGGYYSVSISDTSGCIISDSVEVYQNQPIGIITQTGPASCPGVCNGFATVAAQGNGPFNFLWNTQPLQVADSVSGLCEGSYLVTVTDSIGCSVVDTAVISSPPQISFSFTTINSTCANICNGSAVISPSVPGSYTFKWRTVPYQYGASATGLCDGYTLVEIKTVFGCVYVDSVLIISPDPLFVAVNSIDPKCYDQCDGAATCIALGGQAGFTYLWSNGVTSQQAFNLCSGLYTVTVTDAAGCTGQTDVLITEPDSINIVFTVIDASCNTCNDGSVSASSNGGTPAYFYFWTPGGAIGNSISDLLPGVYNLCVVDANLCVHCSDVEVSYPNGISSASSLNVLISVSPNPFIEKTHIMISGFPKNIYENSSIKIYDIGSRELNSFSYSVAKTTDGEIDFTISNNGTLPGLYFYEIISYGQVIFSGKLILTSR